MAAGPPGGAFGDPSEWKPRGFPFLFSIVASRCCCCRQPAAAGRASSMSPFAATLRAAQTECCLFALREGASALRAVACGGDAPNDSQRRAGSDWREETRRSTAFRPVLFRQEWPRASATFPREKFRRRHHKVQAKNEAPPPPRFLRRPRASPLISFGLSARGVRCP